ncbi:MAG: alpha/beta hydrolase family esterase [Corynebacterium flavescens]|uniref:alpha/beta hydrolase family esterase n=1 Tax=Corynebacterium flavescens TaxID=28028 RepID=UPI003F910383
MKLTRGRTAHARPTLILARPSLIIVLIVLVAAALIAATVYAGAGKRVDEPAYGSFPPARAQEVAANKYPPSSGSTKTGHYEEVGLPSGRSFIIHVPDSYQPSHPLPVVLALHGYKGNAASMLLDTKLYEADALTVFSTGKGKAWAPAPYARTSVDEDLAYIDAILSYTRAVYATDGRFFAAGFSNGGGLIHVLACQRSAEYSGLAAISAANYDAVNDDCERGPIPYLDIHGTADVVMHYDGGSAHGKHYESVAQDMEQIAKHNGCNPFPERQRNGASSANSVNSPIATGAVKKYRWHACDAPTEHYEVVGGTHTWNGSLSDSRGLVPQKWATSTVLDFFGIARSAPLQGT